MGRPLLFWDIQALQHGGFEDGTGAGWTFTSGGAGTGGAAAAAALVGDYGYRITTAAADASPSTLHQEVL